MNDDRPTLIMDSNFLISQSFYTGVNKLSFDGQATGLIFAFLSRILHLGELFRTNDMVFCWDSRKSKRRDRYPWYKIRRHSTDEMDGIRTMRRQARALRRKVLPAIGFQNQFVQPGYEADDLIAACVMGKLGEFVIVTGDEDLFQCLQSNTRIYFPSKLRTYTRKRFRQEYGIEPSQWRSVKAIAGCSSDTVPGVKGVGTKTAIKFLRGFLDRGVKSGRITCSTGTEIIERNMWLVSLPLPGTQEITIEHDPLESALPRFKEICSHYGFHSFMQKDHLRKWERFFKGEFDENE